MEHSLSTQLFGVFSSEAEFLKSNIADEILSKADYQLCFEDTRSLRQQLRIYVCRANSEQFTQVSTPEYELLFCGETYPACSFTEERSFDETQQYLETLDGQFTFLLWHREKKQLYAGNDLLAWKALYYAKQGNAVFLANDFSLIESSDIHLKTNVSKINTRYLSQYILGAFTTTSETIKPLVTRLSPAHYLSVSQRKDEAISLRQYRYWQPEAESSMTKAEVISEIRKLLISAVERRKKSLPAISLMLSGGLDSSVIALCDQQTASENSLIWHSMFFPGRDCDESRYIAALCKMHGRSSEIFEFVRDSSLSCNLDRISSEVKTTANFPNYPNGHLVNLLRSKAAEGSEYIVTGYGGDELFSGRHIAHSPSLSERLLYSLSSQVRRIVSLGSKQRYFGLNKTLKILSERAQESEPNRPGFEEQSRFSQYRQHTLFSGTAVHYRELETTYSPIKMLHPYYDRRLIDFCFTIPEKFFGEFKEYKPLLRTSFRSELPDEISQRKDKASFNFVWQHCISQLDIKTLRFERLAQLELIDEIEVMNLATRIFDKEEQRFEALSLFWNILAAEQLCAAYE